jgi:hypothetical protein
MRSFKQFAVATAATFALILGTAAVPAQAVDAPALNLSLTVGNLSTSTVSGFGTEQTLSLTLTLASGTMRFDAGASTAKLISLTNPGSTLFIQGTQDQIATAFSAISFNNDCGGAIDLSASLESGGGILNSYNGHYYRLVQQGVSFADALANAATLTFDGAPSGTPGYLATITSDGENDFLFTIMGGSGQNAWIGGSDSETEGDWKWITGPEAGTSFYSGNVQQPVHGPVNGEFNGWNESEPNQFFGDDNGPMSEDYVEVYGSGDWNDIPSEAGRLNYYVVEWGGMPGDNFTTAITLTDTASLAAQPPFAVGDGTEATPYEVSTVAELAKVGECSGDGVFFKQTADFDLTGLAFSPIGNDNKYFKGTYDGNNHKIEGFVADSYGEALFGQVGNGSQRTVIKNLTVKGSIGIFDESYAGIVSARADNATFSNLEIDMTAVAEESARYIAGVSGYANNVLIEDVNVTGTLNVSNDSQRIGGLVGRGIGTQIEQSSSSVVITGQASGRIGGVAGQLYDSSSLTDVTFTGSINIADSYAIGGLAGYADSSSILRSSSTGAITSDFGNSIGGLIGEGYSMIIDQSFAAGVVNGGSAAQVGGLIGQLYFSTVTDSYASGDVTGSDRVGALFGYTEDGTYDRVHANGLVTTTGNSNGLIGQGYGSMNNSFWSPELLGIVAGEPVSNELAMTLIDAQSKATYENAGWSIGQDEVLETNVWTMCANFNDGTPFLSWAYPDVCLDLQVLKPVPTVTGSGAALSELTAVPGTWDDGTTLTYTWYADGVEIVGSNATTYTPTLAQIGALITFKVTSTKEGFVTETSTSSPVGPITSAVMTLKPVPTISGTGTVGDELTANPGTWDADVVLAYKWFVNGVEIAAATASTYTPGEDQVGGVVSVQVTATKAGYVTEVKVSTSNKTIKAVVVKPVVKPLAKSTSFGEMVGNSWWMTDAMKSGVRKAVKANSKSKSLVCTGIVNPVGTKAWIKTVGLKRAEAACWIAKLQNPKLKVSYKYVTSKPTDKVQRGFTLTFNK